MTEREKEWDEVNSMQCKHWRSPATRCDLCCPDDVVRDELLRLDARIVELQVENVKIESQRNELAFRLDVVRRWSEYPLGEIKVSEAPPTNITGGMDSVEYVRRIRDGAALDDEGSEGGG